MGKGIKILGKVLSAAVLLLLIVPVVLSMLLDIPAVQNFVVHKAMRVVSHKLETAVRIDRVDIGLFSKIRIEGLYVEDYNRDTLLYVGRLDAYVTRFGLFGGGVELSRGVIADARLCLREMPDGEMNIKRIVSRLSNPDKKKKGDFRLTLNRAAIEGMDLCIERRERRNPPYGIDFSHLHVCGIRARVDDFTIDGQSIYTTIETLSARERSGFALNRFSGRFYLTGGCMGFDEAVIVTDRSDITIPYVSLAGGSWEEYRDFLGEVRIDAALRNSRISTDDLAYFAPSLRDWHLEFSDIGADIAGYVDDFKVRIRSMQIDGGTWLSADASITGLPDIARTRFDLTVPHLGTTGRAADRIAQRIAGRRLPESLLQMLDNSGRIDVSARFQGLLSSFDLRMGAATALGGASCNLHLKPLSGGLRRVRGDVATRNLRLGELLGYKDQVGSVTISARVDGTVGRGSTDANIIADVSQLGFNGYIYDSLRFDGRLRNREFDGRITARDPHLDFDFLGTVDLNDSVPAYDFTMDLRRADLSELHINRRDSLARLSARLQAKAAGRSLDDLNGSIRISDITYLYNDKRLEAASMTVTGENSENSKLVELRSDFADATFRSKTSYRVVFDYLKRCAWKYLPTLRDTEPLTETATRKTAVANDYSLLSVRIRNFNPVADAVSAGLQIADGSSLQMLFNPASDQLSLRASSEYVERKRMLATRLNINASNRGDSLELYASAEDLYAGALHLPHLSVTGGARQGRIQLSTGFTDTARKFSGLIGARTEVIDDGGPDGRVMQFQILPSHITRGNTTWRIAADNIQLDTARMVIDRFHVMNNDQELLIDGVASRSRDDSVTLQLRDFDLSPFTQFAGNMGYVIEGRSSGSASMKSVFRGGEIRADIRLDSLEINDIPVPSLRITSRWNVERNRAGVMITDRMSRDTLIRGFYDPEQVRYYARMNVRDIDLGLLDPLLSGVISSTSGRASADLVLQGQRRIADLTGEIRIADLRTTVDYTGVAYDIPQAVMKVNNNLFRVSNVAMFDPDGNRGQLDLELNLQHLSNIGYDLRVAPQQMLVLDTNERDNDYFYGTVYATGTARISGNKSGVNLDIAAATEDESSFYMPLSSRSNISDADFIVFVKPPEKDTLDNVALKKLMFERKRRQTLGTDSRMNISLALEVRPNVEVELMVAGNAVRARGEGMLNLQIDPRSNIFEMYGDYTITEGNYNFSLQNLINKRFLIASGSTIQWTGSPMDARLDIEAEYKLKASLQPLFQSSVGDSGVGADRSVPVECVIHLGGRLTDPEISFDVRVPGSDPETQMVIANALNTPETVDMQFLYLLLFNSFMSENSLGASSGMGTSVSAATGLELLSSMLSNMLSASDYNIILRYRPKSETMSDEVDVGLSTSLINNRLLVEVESNYLLDSRQAVNSSMSNFMGEAYITYLIDRAGTLKLKAFTQTIDRFDENQGLQETGIGIYFKEDFDNFRDLRQRIRERFTNKKRRARREERRRAAADEADASSEEEREPFRPDAFRDAEMMVFD